MAFEGPNRFDLSPDRKNYLLFDRATSRVHLYADSTLVNSWGASAVGFLGATPAAQQTGTVLSAITTTSPVSGTGYGFSHAAASQMIATVNELRRVAILFGWHTGAAA